MYLHDDTSHNVLEGLLELCKAVISRVKFKIVQKNLFIDSNSANCSFTLPNRIPQLRLSTDLLWHARSVII